MKFKNISLTNHIAEALFLAAHELRITQLEFVRQAIQEKLERSSSELVKHQLECQASEERQ